MTRVSAEQERLRAVAPEAIVIGGSAGALDALTRMLGALPADVTLPIVIVLHVARHRPSELAQVLASSVDRCVDEAQDKAPLTANCIYIAPPDYHLLIDEGPAVALSVDEPLNHSIPSIDVMFESAADTLGPSVIAILLSGANDDGARGLHAIVEAGGHAMIQAPGEASNAAMPEAGLRMNPGVPALRIAEICDQLRKLAQNKRVP